MNTIKTIFVIIGSIIGAGFASGKEIYEYFAKFGSISILYCLPLFFLFFILIKTYLNFGSKFKSSNLKTFNIIILNSISSKKVKFNFINIFMFLTFFILSSAMYSGLFSLFKTYFPNLNGILPFLAIFILSYLFTKGSFKFLNVISFIVVPLIIVYLIINSTYTFNPQNITIFTSENIGLLPVLCLLYASQNTFLCSYILIKSGSGQTKKQQNQTAFFSALILILLIVFGIICLLSCPNSTYHEMPFAICAFNISNIFGAVYGLIIFCAIITTYLSTLTSLKEYFKGEKKYNKQIVMVLLIALFSLINFGVIVKYLYPIIGAFGVVYFVFTNKASKNIPNFI